MGWAERMGVHVRGGLHQGDEPWETGARALSLWERSVDEEPR